MDKRNLNFTPADHTPWLTRSCARSCHSDHQAHADCDGDHHSLLTGRNGQLRPLATGGSHARGHAGRAIAQPPGTGFRLRGRVTDSDRTMKPVSNQPSRTVLRALPRLKSVTGRRPSCGPGVTPSRRPVRLGRFWWERGRRSPCERSPSKPGRQSPAKPGARRRGVSRWSPSLNRLNQKFLHHFLGFINKSNIILAASKNEKPNIPGKIWRALCCNSSSAGVLTNCVELSFFQEAVWQGHVWTIKREQDR